MSHVLNDYEVNALSLCLSLSMSLFGFHSSDSESHFDTPEAATPVHTLPTFPGELENSNADPDKAGEATAEQNAMQREEICLRHKHATKTFILLPNTNMKEIII